MRVQEVWRKVRCNADQCVVKSEQIITHSFTIVCTAKLRRLRAVYKYALRAYFTSFDSSLYTGRLQITYFIDNNIVVVVREYRETHLQYQIMVLPEERPMANGIQSAPRARARDQSVASMMVQVSLEDVLLTCFNVVSIEDRGCTDHDYSDQESLRCRDLLTRAREALSYVVGQPRLLLPEQRDQRRYIDHRSYDPVVIPLSGGVDSEKKKSAQIRIDCGGRYLA